ncbi:uncharacterized protein LOC135463168 [Liolophura sinensis]|uniref:uncharacterized protein LOC135463168 n=1 Tax=Liolophura sinensis TaxID=3198878 RepID=UPI003158E6D1
MPAGMRQLRTMVPADIRFTQIRISNIFGRPDENRGRNIGETLDDLCDDVCTVGSIDPVRVFRHKGHWWSMDNRRLWVFRQFHAMGRCDEIPVIITTREEMNDDKFDATTGKDIFVRGPISSRWYKKAQADKERAIQKKLGNKGLGRETQHEKGPMVGLRATARAGSNGRPAVNLVHGKRGRCVNSATGKIDNVPASINRSPFWSRVLLGFLIACVLFTVYHYLFSINERRRW